MFYLAQNGAILRVNKAFESINAAWRITDIVTISKENLEITKLIRLYFIIIKEKCSNKSSFQKKNSKPPELRTQLCFNDIRNLKWNQCFQLGRKKLSKDFTLQITENTVKKFYMERIYEISIYTTF